MADAAQPLSFAEIVVAPLEGGLLRDSDLLPCYMLMALEASGPFRALVLLLASPLISIISTYVSYSFSIKLLVFLTTAGLKLSDVRGVATAVLPKFFLDNLDPATYRAFSRASASAGGCATCVISSHPKLFIEYFLRTHLHCDIVLASELQFTKSGVCTGFLVPSGSLLSEDAKAHAITPLRCGGAGGAQRTLRGICVAGKQHGYLSQCQETIMVQQSKEGEKLPRNAYPTPLIFHDGRLTVRPTPLVSLMVALWMPVGFMIALLKVLIGLTLPQEVAFPLLAVLGIKLRVQGAPPLFDFEQKGVLYACVHRTPADAIFLTMALRRKVHCLTYSLSKVSEYISPIPCTSLTRNREEDAKIIKGLLEARDLCVCPEGTTCREPFLLRFSPLFAEFADWIVPVALEVEPSLFHASSARGFKFLDGFFLGMNPSLSLKVTFLEPISKIELQKNGKTTIEIANLVQRRLAKVLDFDVTNFTRKDKYSLLAGNDGKVR